MTSHYGYVRGRGRGVGATSWLKSILLISAVLLSSCFISFPPELRGWLCDNDGDCLNLKCYRGKCRKPCERDVECSEAYNETCRDGFCLPPCLEGEKRPCYTGPKGTAGKAHCREGVQYCTKEEKWGPCRGELLPKREICNGKDDDCDGKIDNGIKCECIIGQRGRCYDFRFGCQKVGGKYKCRGICRAGYTICQKDGRWGKCTKQQGPEKEVCNGKDDDCDGKVDETFPEMGKGCSIKNKLGPCAKGVYTCKNGFLTCSPTYIKEAGERCDGIDNDCDGKIDNNPGMGDFTLTRSCYTEKVGCIRKDGQKYECIPPCQYGVNYCLKPGIWSTICRGENTPSPEKCNGKDDDCDGQIDEGSSLCKSPKKCIKGVCQ